jgi:hypothetical protein
MNDQMPSDATGRYQDYNGRMTWIKDIDDDNPEWILGRLWSDARKRWRTKRERVIYDGFRPLDDEH